MKKIFFASLFLVAIAFGAEAQHVRVQIGFPVGVRVGAPGPRPYGGAVWVGPEWQWRGGRYQSVPGYWARPQRHHSVWKNGYWKHSRRGYRWIPGYWR